MGAFWEPQARMEVEVQDNLLGKIDRKRKMKENRRW